MSASAALDRLRRAGFPAPPPPAAAAAAAVITGTGFWGPERAAIRELAGLAGLAYSGDLVRGATTYLVLVPQAGAAASRKLHKAAEWGVPVVRLGWLVDSIAAGQLQPVQPYLLDIEDEPAAAPAAAEAPGWQQQQQQAPAAGAGQAWPERHRPSSIASNALQAAQQAACGDAFNSGPPEQQQPLQQPQQQQQPQQRGALAAVDNLLADQLCRMCISPEPPQHASSVAAPAGQQQQQQQPPAAGSRAQQRSPSASPQRSLSLAGMVAGGQQAAAGESPAADASTMQDSPENDGAGGQQPEGWSPMQQSPADLAPAWQQPQQPQQRSRLSRPGSASPFAFSLAGALGRSISEGPAHGSPMADSPAAAVPAAEPSVVSMEAASAGGAAQASPAPRAMSDGQASGGGSQGDPLCTMPTPACIRAWTDDDCLSGSPPAALPGGATPDDAGVTQTPPAVRQAIADTLGATQRPPAACQQQQQQQRAVSPPPPQLQQQAAEPEQPEPTAAQEWSDAETVASEPPPAGDLVVSDSESDEEPVPAPRPQQPAAAQPQQPPASVAGRPSAAQKRGGLLQVSRPGQAASSGRLPVAPWPLSQPREQAPAAAAAAAGGHEAAQPSPCADWVPAMSGSLDALPAAAAGPPAVDDYGSPGQAAAGSPPQQQEWPAGSPDLQGLVATGRRLLLPQQAPAARPSVRDWSEDDSDEFPTPTGRRGRGMGQTGLTQLDPNSIVIARPKASGSTTWLSGGQADAGGVCGLKFLQRPPRGNAVRPHHGLASLKGVQFAEQVQLPARGLLLSTKDKKTAVRLQPGGAAGADSDDDDFQPDGGSSGRRSSASSRSGRRTPAAGQQPPPEEPVLAEAQTFYRLPDGTWWLELCRFYTAAQAEAAAAAAGAALALPPGFDRDSELLRAVAREHAPMSDIAGGMQIRRVKQGGAALRLRGGTAASASRSYFWRLGLDTGAWRVVTDRAASDYIAE